MPISVALLFHFNQHFHEYAHIASRACYRGLLRVLRAHPSLKFNIHVSGTLIHALQWLDREPLDLIRDGLKDRQFEMLGSTYAQNVLYASDDWDNARQIEMHRTTIRETFAVEPAVFWNVERCWRQSLVPLIAGGGYTATLVEDHILRSAGATDPFPVTTRAGADALKIIWDDSTLKDRFNFAAWFGRSRQVLDYLRDFAARPDSGRMCLAYAEDAEAIGLWGWERGVLPNQTWAQLDALLTALEAEPDIRLIWLSEAPPAAADLTPIPDGAAAWMDRALRTPGLPYHEDGYADWFDFNRRSTKLNHFRHTFEIVRSKLLAAAPATPGAQCLSEAALRAYLAHQYEFGCIGVGGLNYRGWEDLRTAVAVAFAARLANNPVEIVIIDDCNGDGSDEVLVSDGRNLIITSAYGGRLLYWFDLLSGQQFIGNQMPVIEADYEGDGHYPKLKTIRHPALPESEEARLPDSAQLSEVDPPTPFGPYLPDSIWEGEPSPLKLALTPEAPPVIRRPLYGQTRAFCDLVALQGEVEELPAEWLDSRLEKNGVTFIRYLSDELTLEKTYRLQYGRMVIVAYTLRNLAAEERTFRLRITHELCPDYDDVIRHGRETLAFIADPEAPGVLNTRTHTPITVHSSRPWQALETREDFCALALGLVFDVTIGPRSEQKFEMKLARGKEPR
jgi:hypothetical protein